MRIIVFLFVCFFSAKGFAQSWNWVDRVQGPGNNYVFTVKADDYDGFVYSTGRVKSTGTFGEISTPTGSIDYGDRDVFLTKHDLSGNLIWVKRFGGLYTDYGSLIEVTPDFVFVMGFFTDTVIIDNTDTLVSNGMQDVFLIQFDKNGNLIYSKSFGGPGNDQTDGATLDNYGNIYIAGSFEDSINFDGINLINTINSTTYPNTKSTFLVKLNPSFNALWATKQQSTAYVVHTDMIERDGFVYITGYYSGVCQFYPGVSLTMISSFFQSSLMKITTDGDFVWVKGFGGNYSDILASIDFDENNFLYAGGTYRGIATYQSEVFSSPPAYLDNGMIVKFDTSGTVLSSFAFPSSSNGRVESVNVVDDKVYAAGYFSDSLFVNNDTILGQGLYDMVIIGLDTALNLGWLTFQGGTSYDQIRNIDVFDDHSIAFGGSIKNTITFPTISFTTVANTYDGVMGIVTPPVEARLKNFDTVFCINETLTIYNSSIGSIDNVVWDAGSLSVLFSDADSIVLTSNSAGAFQVELSVSNLTESDSIISKLIYFNANSSVDISADTLQACLGEVITIEATGLFNELIWSTSETTSQINAASTGWYYVSASLSGACPSQDSVYCNLDFVIPEIVIAEDSLEACMNSDIEISVTGVYDSVEWSTGSNDEIITVNSSGWYYVTGTSSNICYATDSIYVDLNLQEPVLLIETSDSLICDGAQTSLMGSGTFDALSWSTGETGTEIIVNAGGWYAATAMSIDGCETEDSVFIGQVNCLSISQENSVTIVEVFSEGQSCFMGAVPFNDPTYFQIYDLGNRLIDFGLIEDNKVISKVTLSKGCYVIIIDGVWTAKFVKLE